MANFVIRRARSDRQKDIMIDAIVERIAHPLVGDITLNGGTITLFNTISPAFHNDRISWFSTGGLQSAAVSDTKIKYEFLSLVIRNCLRNFKGDVKEGIYISSDFTFYGMNPGRPILPDVKSEAKAMAVAKVIIDGEAARVLAGRPAYARVSRVVAALATLKASIILRTTAIHNHDTADSTLRTLAATAAPILLTISNEVEGKYDTLTKEQQHIRGGNWGLVWISVGNLSVINIRYVDDVTGLTLGGVLAELDETGAQDTGNANGEATINTEAFGALIINSSRIDYTDKSTLITTTEGSISTIIIRLVKIIV